MVDLDFELRPEQSCLCGSDARYGSRCKTCGEPVCDDCLERYSICEDCAEKEAGG
jgi:hypothetical protein